MKQTNGQTNHKMWILTIISSAIWIALVNCQTLVDTYCSTPKCYTLYKPEAGAITWQGAFAACLNIGQRLAIIQDFEAQKTLKRFVKVPGSDGHAWVAGRRSDDATWRDVKGREFSNISALGDWRCAVINFHATTASQISVTNWLCLDEGEPLKAVCQYNGTVLDGVPGFYKNGNQYIVSPAKYQTWNEARQYCINNHGDLAYSDVTDPDWQAFFWGRHSSSRLWVGVCKNCWKWKIGRDELPMIFTNWEENEGSNIEENCLHLDLNAVGINYWADKPCDTQATSSSYICETINIHGTPSHISTTLSGVTLSTTISQLTTSSATTLATVLPTEPTISTSPIPPVIPTTSITTPTTSPTSATTPSTLPSSSSATTPTTQPPSTSRKPSPTLRPTDPTDPVNPIPPGNDTIPTLLTNKPVGTTRRPGPTQPTNSSSITPPSNAPNATNPAVTDPTNVLPTNSSSVQPNPSGGSSLPTVIVPSVGSSIQPGSPSSMPTSIPGSSPVVPGSSSPSSTTVSPSTAQSSSKATPSTTLTPIVTAKPNTPATTPSTSPTLKSSTGSTTLETVPTSPTAKATSATTEGNVPVRSNSKPDFSINSTNFYIILLTLVGVCVVITFAASFYFVRRSRNRKRSKVVRHRDAATSFNAHMAAGVVPSGSLSSVADIKDLTLPIPDSKFLSPSNSVCDDDTESVAVTLEEDDRRGSMDSGLSIEHRRFKSGTSLDNWSLITPTLPRSCLKKPTNHNGDGTLSSDWSSILPEAHKLQKFSDERFDAPLLDSEGRFTAPSSPTPSGFRSRRGSKEIQFTSLRQANKTKSVQWFDEDTYSKAKKVDDDDEDDDDSGAAEDEVGTTAPVPPIVAEQTPIVEPETAPYASPNKEACRANKADSAQAEIVKFPDTTTDRRIKSNVQYEDIDEVLDNVKNFQIEVHSDAGDYEDIPTPRAEELTPRSETGSSGSEGASSDQTEASSGPADDISVHSGMKPVDGTSLEYGSGTSLQAATGKTNDGADDAGSSDSDRGDGTHVDSQDDDSQITLLENDHMSRL